MLFYLMSLRASVFLSFQPLLRVCIQVLLSNGSTGGNNNLLNNRDSRSSIRRLSCIHLYDNNNASDAFVCEGLRNVLCCLSSF